MSGDGLLLSRLSRTETPSQRSGSSRLLPAVPTEPKRQACDGQDSGPSPRWIHGPQGARRRASTSANRNSRSTWTRPTSLVGRYFGGQDRRRRAQRAGQGRVRCPDRHALPSTAQQPARANGPVEGELERADPARMGTRTPRRLCRVNAAYRELPTKTCTTTTSTSSTRSSRPAKSSTSKWAYTPTIRRSTFSAGGRGCRRVDQLQDMSNNLSGVLLGKEVTGIGD